MAIYRGSGGAGDATGDATNSSQLALAAAAEAQASANSAASSATNAANSASAAATDATDAATSETNAAGSAADALASENAAALSATAAATSASAASTSATNAASSASTASTQATNASNSASSASTSASAASTSATSASTSASSASTSASSAATSATNAGNSATAAATSATDAAASASTASTQATNASTSATNAASSASAASTSATNAASSASTASTAATNASNSASAASTSASNAATSETNAASSASSAASSASSAASSASDAADSAALAATFDPALYLTKANPSFTGNLTASGTGQRITGDFSNATNANRVMFQSSTTNGYTAIGTIPNGTSTQSFIVAYNNSDPTNSSSMQIDCGTAAAFIRSNITGTGTYLPMTFHTGGSERMRIDSSGNLLVGTTSVSGRGTFYRDPVTNCSLAARTDANGYLALDCRNASSGQAGYVYVNASSVNYNTTSDYRLKENVQPMIGALSVVQQLHPVTYTWKEDGSDGQGFIAHELQSVVPDAVTGEKDAVDADGNPVYQGIDTSFLVATLTAAIQELKAELDAAKDDIAALKGTA